MPRPASKPKPPQQRTQNIEATWLLRALAVIFAAALLSTYATLCVIFYRSQWQAVLHPVRSTAAELPKGILRFAPGDSGQPELTGEWIPAASNGRYSNLTVLFLSGGDGNRENFTETQASLHQLGLNVFTFDYRGYGRSANIHPSQQSMTEDTESTWKYLTGVRRIPPASILPYGVGVGASLATGLAIAHSEIPAVALDSPYTDLRKTVALNPRFRLLPTSLLFKDEFPLAGPLSNLKKPKLLISTTGGAEPTQFLAAADPKITVSFKTSSGPLFNQAMMRFLDQYLAIPLQAPSDTKLH
jgi:hypothetical protein